METLQRLGSDMPNRPFPRAGIPHVRGVDGGCNADTRVNSPLDCSGGWFYTCTTRQLCLRRRGAHPRGRIPVCRRKGRCPAPRQPCRGSGRPSRTAAPWLFHRSVAPKTGPVVKYDPDFAFGQLTSGGGAKASQLVDFAESQGWKRVQTQSGPIKYLDEGGVERVVIKRGSPRTPGSEDPHVAIRNAAGERVDPYGDQVSRRSPGNHTPIEWDLPE